LSRVDEQLPRIIAYPDNLLRRTLYTSSMTAIPRLEVVRAEPD